MPSILESDPLPNDETEFKPTQGLRKKSPDQFSQKNLVYGAASVFLNYAADMNLVPHKTYVNLIQSALKIRWGLIRMAASRLEKYGLEPGQYVALHRRQGDFLKAYYKGRADIRADAMAKHVKPHVEGKTLLVLAEPGTADSEFSEFLIKLKTVAGASRVVCWVNENFTDRELDFGAQIDMLAAVPASKFIGSPVSTFSYGIIRWRVQAGWHKLGFPLLWTNKAPVGGSNDWNSPGSPGTYFTEENGTAMEPWELAWQETSWFIAASKGKKSGRLALEW
eukprot:TRINITY_DN19522_c0_g1_i2.p1 TRINITY_DN19522_c0_g1~~TRINITY_DN19522_c0_g1_i2.p1  ORF type:complete len:279 (-),score=42.04 TRINITY_DN19522_c0_g1_i2:91-927(-)